MPFKLSLMLPVLLFILAPIPGLAHSPRPEPLPQEVFLESSEWRTTEIDINNDNNINDDNHNHSEPTTRLESAKAKFTDEPSEELSLLEQLPQLPMERICHFLADYELFTLIKLSKTCADIVQSGPEYDRRKRERIWEKVKPLVQFKAYETYRMEFPELQEKVAKKWGVRLQSIDLVVHSNWDYSNWSMIEKFLEDSEARRRVVKLTVESYRAFFGDQWNSLAQGFPNVRQFESTVHPRQGTLAHLVRFPHLNSLEFSKFILALRNEKQVREFIAILTAHKNHLKKLAFIDLQLGGNADENLPENIMEELTEALHGLSQLEFLEADSLGAQDVYRHQVQRPKLKLERFPKLEVLSLAGSVLNSEQMDSLLAGLSSLKALKTLNLEGISLTDHQIELIKNAIQNSQARLTKLQITLDFGTSSNIGQLLAVMPHLAALSVAESHVGVDGLLAELEKVTELRELELMSLELDQQQTDKLFQILLAKKGLKKLGIHHCTFGSVERGGVFLFQNLQNWPKIEQLEISGIQLRNEDLRKFVQAIPLTLEKLELSRVNFSRLYMDLLKREMRELRPDLRVIME